WAVTFLASQPQRLAESSPPPTAAPPQIHIKFWEPLGEDLSAFIRGQMADKRTAYGEKLKQCGGPELSFYYTVNKYDFSKVDLNNDGKLEEFKDPSKPTLEEQELIRRYYSYSGLHAYRTENVYLVPQMSDRSLGEQLDALGRSAIVINFKKVPPEYFNPNPTPSDVLAHENTHLWQMNADNHTEDGKPLPAENIGACGQTTLENVLACTNAKVFTPKQIKNLISYLKPPTPTSGATAAAKMASELLGEVNPGSVGNRINFRFTNRTPPGIYGTMKSLRVRAVHSTPTFVSNFRPTTAALTPATLAPNATGTASFTFDVAPNAELGTECMVELVVTCDTGDEYYYQLWLTTPPPPTSVRHWQLFGQ
ncbi:MAG: hypothetical protein N3D11_18035, partial [Candidatus Sumerlaeia bacterium]|nr:hypothetical protein [Candidatus Sumerlaeia bacterium]